MSISEGDEHAWLEYAAAELRHLHGLIREGRGDSEDADEARAEVEHRMHSLTPADKARLQDLSERLYADPNATL